MTTHNKQKFQLTINSEHFEWDQQFITGSEIRKLGNIQVDHEIFLRKNENEEQLINDETRIDLSSPGVEHFFSRIKIRKFFIDKVLFEWPKQFIKGIEIRQLRGIEPTYQIFLVVKGSSEDKLINDNDNVDLDEPGVEHFYSCKPNTNNG